jgi:glycosyltransferase involved in cell wall biosynthesis
MPELDVVGVAAWHRRLPRPPFRPPLPVERLPLPQLALYEAWHAFRRPRIERATGPVHVIHATGLAMPPRVRVFGFVPSADLGPLYAGASVFCFPSLLEGFGLPVVEAMAQGHPS